MAKLAYRVLYLRDFRFFITARFLFTFGVQMQAVVVGWQVYEYTRDAWALGLIGLAEALPFLVTGLIGGHVSDTVERKKVILVAVSLYWICALVLLLISWKFDVLLRQNGIGVLYVVIFFTGIARGFLAPSSSAFMSQLVHRPYYTYSSTWNSTVWHIAAVTGPAAGGLIYGWFGVVVSYMLVLLFVSASLIMYYQVKARSLPPDSGKDEPLFTRLTAGLNFVFRKPEMLGAMALDMFAVLFGGAVAMLPVFADTILHVGPQGLGVLRAAPAMGAILMAFVLANNPPLHNAGKKLLASIGVFGLCMVLFALSTNFYLSFVLLLLSGMFDNVSVIIRNTIVQMFTPDEMRGRVSAVSSLFIGSSNEIGAFESGAAARILGLVPSVIFGGCITLGIVAGMWYKVPKLRNLQLKE